MPNLNVPTLAIITGASRGLGQSTAFQLAKRVDSGSVMYLTARTQERLDETARQIKQEILNEVEVSHHVYAQITNIRHYQWS